jgi:hypothetical protein
MLGGDPGDPDLHGRHGEGEHGVTRQLPLVAQGGHDEDGTPGAVAGRHTSDVVRRTTLGVRGPTIAAVATTSEPLEVSRTDLAPVLEAMAELSVERNGWINLQPLTPDDADDASQGGFFGLFSGRGPEVPLCTWSPGERRRRGDQAPSIGIQHGTGPKVANRLAELGRAVPAGWSVAQDHSRRGLVLTLPQDEPLPRVLRWLLDAGEALCPVAVTGRWIAEVFRTDP